MAASIECLQATQLHLGSPGACVQATNPHYEPDPQAIQQTGQQTTPMDLLYGSPLIGILNKDVTYGFSNRLYRQAKFQTLCFANVITLGSCMGASCIITHYHFHCCGYKILGSLEICALSGLHSVVQPILLWVCLLVPTRHSVSWGAMEKQGRSIFSLYFFATLFCASTN